jgi:hypothetical protein
MAHPSKKKRSAASSIFVLWQRIEVVPIGAAALATIAKP